MGRETFCTLSADHLAHNLGVIRAKAPRAKIMAMVKANAYGHGLRAVGQRLASLADALGVASIDEAIMLRQSGIRGPITLVEGVFTPDELPLASAYGFHVVFHSPHQLRWLAECRLSQSLVAWLKLDTGMGRLGFLPSDAPEAMQALEKTPYVQQPIGLMSHLACADTPDHPLNQRQIMLFQRLTREHLGPKSLCNSAAIFAFPDQHYDWVRPGLALYGASPLQGRAAQALDLKPVMTPRTRLISIKTLKKGASVGYGGRFVCPEDMQVGILAIGYGDGYPRTARDGTPVLIDGVRCPLIGCVSMDMIAVDLRPCPRAPINAEAVLWGDELPVEDVALHTANSPYDLLTGVQNRMKLQWTQTVTAGQSS